MRYAARRIGVSGSEGSLSSHDIAARSPRFS
jgi:hypothetical protein